MLVAMAGLPASGKSAIAQRLQTALPAVVLDKDQIRAALFAPADIEYSDAQNDLCVRVMFMVAGYLLGKDPHKIVILDGRTYSKRYQVLDLVEYARKLGVPLKIIECICSDQIAQQRLSQDVADQNHLAGNRNYELYLALKPEADPIEVPKLVINTDEYDLASSTALALNYLLGQKGV